MHRYSARHSILLLCQVTITFRFDAYLKLSAVLLVDEDVSVSNVTLVHLGNDLVDIVELSLLDPGVDVLLGGEFEHLTDHRGGALDNAAGGYQQGIQRRHV
jgi:hypothetical protein